MDAVFHSVVMSGVVQNRSISCVFAGFLFLSHWKEKKESHNCYGLDGMESGVTVELHYP